MMLRAAGTGTEFKKGNMLLSSFIFKIASKHTFYHSNFVSRMICICIQTQQNHMLFKSRYTLVPSFDLRRSCSTTHFQISQTDLIGNQASIGCGVDVRKNLRDMRNVMDEMRNGALMGARGSNKLLMNADCVRLEIQEAIFVMREM